jgi:regulator of protease activity HflC (stomatin/prohibitin superfamily)
MISKSLKAPEWNVTISGPAVMLFVASVLVGIAGAALVGNPVPLLVAGVIGLYFLFAVKVVQQWERVALMRLGKYVGLRGPGTFLIVPIVETITPAVDQRIRVTSVTAESTLTRDTVPVNVDAAIFWLVWSAEKALLEVQSFDEAIALSAQTALRESIGRHNLAQMLSEREILGHELQKILDSKTNPWGITVQSVEIRDVQIPPALQDAMSREAQADRERHARVILAQAETQVAEKFSQAAEYYANNPTALHLRAMNMLYEAMKEKGAMVIVPSSAVETMGLGGMLATSTMAKNQ